MPLFFPPKNHVFDAQSIFRLDIMAHGKEYGTTHNKLQTISIITPFLSHKRNPSIDTPNNQKRMMNNPIPPEKAPKFQPQ